MNSNVIMARGLKYCAVYVLVTVMFLSGALVFLKGFLLSRTVIETKSLCTPDFAKTVNPPLHKHEVEGCWMHGRFKRAILIVIDALRYDFLVFNSSTEHDFLPYLNKFPSVDYLLTRKPMHSRLYKLMADPPTTTMQRLKGLTTGSLPTFVDVGSNLQSYEVTEDNWLHQLNKANRRIKFLGDDTWLGLFPNMFKKSFDFPSFDVKDLNTVDTGILKHLYPEIQKQDWGVIIAHFLGVDHCGHRYGPNHPAMAEKLSQMDKVISSVTNLMKNDTILFVMGDHGMTRTGDHGGDSDDEITAGLFVYSPSRLASTPQETYEDAVKQIDFVPTLALLLGVPVPFSNLGMVIPELFSHCPWWDTDSNDVKKVFHKVKALRLNAHQVDTYLESYQQVSSDLPRRELRSLKQHIEKSEMDLQALMSVVGSGKGGSDTLDRLLALERDYISYLRSSRKMCENIWAKFDLKLIFAGLSTLALSAVLTFYFSLVLDEEGSNEFPMPVPFVIFGAILHLVYLAAHIFILPESVPPVMVFVISLVLMSVCFISGKNKVMANIFRTLSFDNVTITIISVISSLLYFSNSFIVHEDKISQFLLQSLILCYCLKIAVANHLTKANMSKQLINKVLKKSSKSFNILQYLTEPSHVAIIIVFICSLFLRFSSNFFACREEQHACEDSFFSIPLSNLANAPRNQRYLFSLFCLGIIVYLTRYWLKYYGNLNGTRASVVCLSYAPAIAAVFTVFHWAFQTLPQTTLDGIPQWQQVIMPQIVYLAIAMSLIAILLSPLLIYVLPSRQESPMDVSKGTIPSLYNQIKLQMTRDVQEKPPMVYGLGSVYSASMVAVCLVTALLLCLLLNDGRAPSMLCAIISLYCALELYSANVLSKQKQGLSDDSIWQDDTWHAAVFLSLFSTSFFYSTGHQATIPSIRMEAAFIGLYGDFNNFLLPGFLVWSNTFASHMFFSLAAPFFIFLPRLSSTVALRMLKEPKTSRSQADSWKGDFSLFNDGIQFRKKLFGLFSKTLLIFGLKMVLAACATTIHRRHLMVWKIFAPRFIYEAAMFTTSSIFLCLSFLFVLRVDTALCNFVKTLPSQKEDHKNEGKVN